MDIGRYSDRTMVNARWKWKTFGEGPNAALLGYAGKLEWSQSAEFLTIEKPSAKPCDFAYTLKIELV